MRIALLYTPTEIHPDVLEWLTEGWQGKQEDAVHFLKHLAALRQGVTTPAEGIIVLEQGVTLAPNFEEKLSMIIPKIPPLYTTCLLSHYVTSWNGIKYVEGTDNLLCTITNNVHGSFAYWLRMSHVEHLLAMYDQPLRNIPAFQLTPEKITRLGNICMLKEPLVARLDKKDFQDYYANYGF